MAQGIELDEAGVANVQKGEWSHVGRSSETYEDKISRTGSRSKNVVENREVLRQLDVNLRLIEKLNHV